MTEKTAENRDRIEVTPEMKECVRAWFDEPENRDSIEQGGYGDVSALLERIFGESHEAS